MEKNEYINFYSKWMDSRIKSNYKTAGGELYKWLESGKRQLDFLKSQGLITNLNKMNDRHYNILEIGFGTFAFGLQLFVDYKLYNTSSSKYRGFDISNEALKKSRELCINAFDYPPNIYNNKDFSFKEFNDSTYIKEYGMDYIWAFSVFNHLSFEHFEEFLDNVYKIINNKTIILLTIWSDEGKTRPHTINTQVNKTTSFWYNMKDVQKSCNDRGYNVELINHEPYFIFITDWIKIIKITKMIE
jgi:hypothetical protein